MGDCAECGRDVEDDARYYRHCGAPIPGRVDPDLGRDIKKFTGEVVEKSVIVAEEVVRAAKPIVKKGVEVTRSAVREVAESTKKAGRKLQEKE